MRRREFLAALIGAVCGSCFSCFDVYAAKKKRKKKKRCKIKQMSNKRIIEFGSYPSGAYIADDASYAQIQSLPIDGFCTGPVTNDNLLYLPQSIWGTYETEGNIREYTIDDFSTFINRVASRATAGFGRTSYNFLIIQTPETTIDWFNDAEISKVVANLKLYGRILAETGFYGIVIEPEQYGTYTWQYNFMPNRTRYTQAQYRARIKLIVELVVEDWLKYNKNINILNWKSYVDADTDPQYDLYGAWMDGIYEELGSKVRIQQRTDNFSEKILSSKIINNNYRTSRITDIDELNNIFYPQLINYQGNTKYFDDLAVPCFEHWVDKYDQDGGGYDNFNNVDLSGNYWTPATSKTAMLNLLSVVDWVVYYNERYHLSAESAQTYQSDIGTGQVINSQYVDVLREIRQELNMR